MNVIFYHCVSDAMRKVAVGLLLLLAMVFTASHAKADPLPKGKDYPVEHIYSGKVAEHVDRSDEFTNLFRTRFAQALKGNVVFAGEYAQAEWGCGSAGCHVVAFINKRTGRALTRTFQEYYGGTDEEPVSIGEEILYMNKNSRLLVTYETSEDLANKSYNYYTLNGDELVLLRKVADKK